MPSILLFNHFHRGDLFTSKEFVRQLTIELKDFKILYQHYNHTKILRDLNIEQIGVPHNTLTPHTMYYQYNDLMGVNTWIGVHGDIFTKNGGVNLQTLTESWAEIFSKINATYGTTLKVRDDIHSYLPRVNYGMFNIKPVDDFVAAHSGKKVLICNGIPMSNQSFQSDLAQEIEEYAVKYPHITFICTKRFYARSKNIMFTDHIINDGEIESVQTFWHDRSQNNCDLNEISYLSTKCDLIIGKNSGPFVFCETYDNFMDGTKSIISFSKGSNESMSKGIHKKCKYNLVTEHTIENIKRTIEKELIDL
jgi:hypothetical protein